MTKTAKVGQKQGIIMPRKKGTPKTGGRQKGTPNKTSGAVKGYLTDTLTAYLQPKALAGKKQPTLEEDLQNMLPAERVRAMTSLAGYVIPKQQAISIEEQTQVEMDALTAWLETAPAEAINGIAAKVLEMQARNMAANDTSTAS